MRHFRWTDYQDRIILIAMNKIAFKSDHGDWAARGKSRAFYSGLRSGLAAFTSFYEPRPRRATADEADALADDFDRIGKDGQRSLRHVRKKYRL
ncbi:hypothetical protein JCM17846_15920 [Iodidimonas nitroreducens]|uniref:Uncharacterized protein n=1 Tax=Iodidimonas nitroreducens TaxID=1236968 RepID=A0A5A7N919_9PROT|nr:hypothetical protein AQ1_01876 [alpha proteobacterium Q-1]GER03910.1 hypothetical protein JCM17846_15920 [Iodidimonas nitroreducens]